MDLANYLEAELEKKRYTKQDFYLRFKSILTEWKEECIAYNTFTTRFNTDSFTGKEFIACAIILGIDSNKLLDVVSKMKIDYIDAMAKNVDVHMEVKNDIYKNLKYSIIDHNSFINEDNSNTNPKSKNYVVGHLKTIKLGIYELFSYNNNGMAVIEEYNFNTQKRKTISLVDNLSEIIDCSNLVKIEEVHECNEYTDYVNSYEIYNWREITKEEYFKIRSATEDYYLLFPDVNDLRGIEEAPF